MSASGTAEESRKEPREAEEEPGIRRGACRFGQKRLLSLVMDVGGESSQRCQMFRDGGGDKQEMLLPVLMRPIPGQTSWRWEPQ